MTAKEVVDLSINKIKDNMRETLITSYNQGTPLEGSLLVNLKLSLENIKVLEEIKEAVGGEKNETQAVRKVKK